MTAAHDTLVIAHRALVRQIAAGFLRRGYPGGVERSELVSAGELGLVEAARRFRVSRHIEFGAFARRRIAGAMLDAIRANDWAPASMRRRQTRITQVTRALRQRLGHEPTRADLVRAMPSYPRQQQLIDGVLATVTVDGPGPSVSVQGESPYTQAERAEVAATVQRALAQLSARDQQVLAWAYTDDLPLSEIGRRLGRCESRACQLRRRALVRLRAVLGDEDPP